MAVGLEINVGKTNLMGVQCEIARASLPIPQKKLEVLTGNHKSRAGTLIKPESNLDYLLHGGAAEQDEECGLVRDASW